MKRRKKRCWKGYKPVKGKRPYSKGSCRKIRRNASREVKVIGYRDGFQYLTDGVDIYRRTKMDKKMNSMKWFSTVAGFPSFLKAYGPLIPTPRPRGIIRNSMSRIPTQQEYEMRELAMFRKQMAEVEKLPLAERKENAREWFKDLRDDQKLIAERVGWLLNGSYGKGSHDSACRVLASPRMNQVAWCAITIANLEWRCPAKMAIESWKKLPVETRYQVNEAIRREIADAKAEGYCGEIKKNGYQPYEFTTTPHRDLRPETRAYLARVPMIRLHNQRKGIVVKTLPANSPKWTEKQKKNIATLLEISTSNRDNISLGDEVYEKFYA